VVAAAALFAREPCPVWISKLVGRNTPNSLWKRIMGSSRDYGCRAEPLFFDSLVAHPCGWNAGLLARTDGATPSATVGGQLLRADYRGDKRAAAFCRNRARDIIHFVYLFPLFALALAWLIDGRDIPGQVYRKLRSGIT